MEVVVLLLPPPHAEIIDPSGGELEAPMDQAGQDGNDRRSLGERTCMLLLLLSATAVTQ